MTMSVYKQHARTLMGFPPPKRMYRGSPKGSYDKVFPGSKNQNTKSIRNVNIASRAKSLKKGYFKSHAAGFPQRFTETVRSVKSVAEASLASNTYFEEPIILNGTFAPGTGVSLPQPAGFVKLMAVYTKCYVRSAKITVITTNSTNGVAGTTTKAPLLCGITISTNGNTLTFYNVAIDCGLETHKVAAANPDTVTNVITVDIGKFLSVDDIMDGPDFYNTAAANPNQIVVGHVWFYNAGATAVTYIHNVQVDFDCIFADPLPVV